MSNTREPASDTRVIVVAVLLGPAWLLAASLSKREPRSQAVVRCREIFGPVRRKKGPTGRSDLTLDLGWS